MLTHQTQHCVTIPIHYAPCVTIPLLHFAGHNNALPTLYHITPLYLLPYRSSLDLTLPSRYFAETVLIFTPPSRYIPYLALPSYLITAQSRTTPHHIQYQTAHKSTLPPRYVTPLYLPRLYITLPYPDYTSLYNTEPHFTSTLPGFT